MRPNRFDPDPRGPVLALLLCLLAPGVAPAQLRTSEPGSDVETSRPLAPDGFPGFTWFFVATFVSEQDVIDAQTVQDIRFPVHSAVIGDANVKVRMTFIAEVPAGDLRATLGGTEDRLVGCEKSLVVPPPPCQEPESAISFNLDDVAICESGNCQAPEIAGDSSGASGRSALLLQNVFPPQLTKIVATDANGDPLIVAEEGDPMPAGGGATFTSLSHVAVGGDRIAYSGSGTGGLAGVYLYDALTQTHSRVVDSTLPRPRAAGNFSDAGALAMHLAAGGWEIAWTDGAGVYVTTAGTAGTIEQPIAAGDSYGAGRIVRSPFNWVAFWPGTDRLITTCFSQFFTYGVYSASRAAPGTIARHADSETPIPGGTGNFSSTQRGSASGDTLFFEAFDASFAFLGVFVDAAVADGPVTPVLRVDEPVTIAPGDTRIVDSLSVNPGSALAPGVGAFLTYFTDGSGAVVAARQPLLIADFEENDLDEWSGHQP